MRKNLIVNFICLLLTFVLAFCFIGCDNACKHSWSVISNVLGTCETEGKIVSECELCGRSKEENLGLGEHIFEWKSDETGHWKEYTCTHEIASTDKEEHTMTEGVCSECSFFGLEKIIKNTLNLTVFSEQTNFIIEESASSCCDITYEAICTQLQYIVHFGMIYTTV